MLDNSVSVQDAEYAYSLSSRTFPSGRTLWRWDLRHTGFPIAAGAAMPTRNAAEEAALRALRQLREGQRPLPRSQKKDAVRY